MALEEELARRWVTRSFPSRGLRTTSGEDVTVADPGQQNTDSGPDFTAAILRFGKGPFERGPVELHRRPSDWRAHGHDSDIAYSAILLHVVADASGHHEIAGRPIVELLTSSPLAGHDGTRRLVSAQELEQLGDARLEATSARLEGDIAALGPEQTLYEGLLGALGYTKNITGFVDLARSVPFQVLLELGSGLPPGHVSRIGGLLFGAAGFLPSQRNGRSIHRIPDTYTTQIEEAWLRYGHMTSLPAETWSSFRVRPDNSPVRRVGAAVELTSSWVTTDLIERLVRTTSLKDPRRIARAAIRTIELVSEGYWGRRRDFGVVRSGGRGAALIGQDRAFEMVANVALPFLIALADWRGDRSLEAAARAAFAAMPAAPDNSLTRWATARSLAPAGFPKPLTARQQQGLLQLTQARV